MEIKIKHRFSGDVLFEVETTSLKLSVEMAVTEKANLRGANLRGANLTGADLTGANLRGADLDFSVFPLWCGSFGIKANKRLAAQLAYHFCRIDFNCKEAKEAQRALEKLANMFHRVDECGKIGGK